jgi:Uma2 family endonuclease
MATTNEEIKLLEETAPRAKPFSLTEFIAVAEALPDRRLELIRGEIVMFPPPDKIHQKHTGRVINLFARQAIQIEALGCEIGGSNCYFEVPAELSQRWAAEGESGPSDICPDASIYYANYWEAERCPPALLVVEVLSVSKREHLERDLVTKPEIYASLEIPAYWIVDRRDQSVWVYTEPKDGKYRSCKSYQGNQVLPAPGLEFLAITSEQIFEH